MRHFGEPWRAIRRAGTGWVSERTSRRFVGRQWLYNSATYASGVGLSAGSVRNRLGGTTTRGDILLWTRGAGKLQPILETPANEYAPEVSPDGHWLAYVSDESGRDEVYVRAFPGSGGKWQISTGGARDPVWRSDGRELFFISGDKMMAVDVHMEPSFSAGSPHELFHGEFEQPTSPFRIYDVSSDGKRFVMISPSDSSQARTQIDVVLNWVNELRRPTAPAKQ